MSACGQDDPDGPSSVASRSADAAATTAGPADTTRAWLDAYAAGDGTAVCALPTPEFSRSEIEGFATDEMKTCEEAVRAVVEVMELAESDGDAGPIESVLGAAMVKLLDESGDTAHVQVVLPDEEPTDYELSRDSGEWLLASVIHAEVAEVGTAG